MIQQMGQGPASPLMGAMMRQRQAGLGAQSAVQSRQGAFAQASPPNVQPPVSGMGAPAQQAPGPAQSALMAALERTKQQRVYQG